MSGETSRAKPVTGRGGRLGQTRVVVGGQDVLLEVGDAGTAHRALDASAGAMAALLIAAVAALLATPAAPATIASATPATVATTPAAAAVALPPALEVSSAAATSAVIALLQEWAGQGASDGGLVLCVHGFLDPSVVLAVTAGPIVST